MSSMRDAMRAARKARSLDRWYERADSTAVAKVQEDRLRRLVAHAAAHSPFHADRLRGIDLGAPDLLRRLPTMDKEVMMADLARALTDPRLREVDLEHHVETLDGDGLLLGRYRVMATSGTSGRRGLFLYDRPAWVEVLSVYAAFMRLRGIKPGLPRPRIASVLAHEPAHMSARVPMSVRAPIFRRLALVATMPVPDMVRALNAFRPDILIAFPANAALLADEQRAGRLSISPTTVAVTAAECTPGVRARVEAGWSLHPFDIYATTETGPAAFDCEVHAGMHILEDRVILEVVDGRLLVTNLVNLVQPILRYELTDVLTIDESPCACGHPGPRIVAIEGRTDDVMQLPDASGRLVPAYPSHFQEAIERMAGVRDYLITQLEDRVEVAVVATRDVTPQIAASIRDNLTAIGLEHTRVDVLLVDEIDRSAYASAKPKRVRALPRDAALS